MKFFEISFVNFQTFFLLFSPCLPLSNCQYKCFNVSATTLQTITSLEECHFSIALLQVF